MDVAWLSLETADNDPHRFFRGIAAAIAHIHPLPMDDVLTLLRSSSLATDDLVDQAILSRMADIPGEIAIVLDDIHLLTGAEQLRSLGRVIEQMPANVHRLGAHDASPPLNPGPGWPVRRRCPDT
jgi:LuxR family maltose regulon positive regulatory protein